MKKTVAILLTLAFIALCGCGAKSQKKDTSASSKSTSSQSSQTSSKQETSSKADEPSSSSASTEKKSSFDIVNLNGNYQDVVSGRATAVFEVTGNNSMCITVNWGNSAKDSVKYTMTAVLSADDKLLYSDETKTHIVTDDNGKQTETVEYSGQSGHFSVSNGLISWDGAHEENCRTCQFEIIK